jgi:acetyl-CoA carboxylase carboxyl transferase subunit beta
MTSNSPAALPSIPGVSVLVVDGARVLLVRRGKEPNLDLWALPGGRIEVGEKPAEAAARETAEETAIVIDDLREIDAVDVVADDGNRYAITVFSARYRSGVTRAGDDAAEARWVALAEIPGMRVTEGTRRAIEKLGKRANVA